MKCLALLLIFSIALCGCPNNCNGHGKCNAGVCECFRSTGVESIPDAADSTGASATYNLESYYGPDCSRKMCPMGISFASLRETGYTVNLEASSAANEPTVVPNRRMDDKLVQGGDGQPEPTASASASAAPGGSGVPDHHMYAECSGAGLCNSETGVCECFDGFEGKACQRMSCPNKCSGKGKCVPISEAVGLDGTTNKNIKDYFGFNGRETHGTPSNTPVKDNDSEAKFFGCLCDKGFRGPDCSLRECPSGEDPQKATNTNGDVEQRDCSGRGTCNYETGECQCFDGYSGASCSSMTTFM